MKKNFLLFSILFFSSIVFGQTTLSNTNYSWSQVTGGKLLLKPVLTPYGFICASDGKTVSSVTNNGVILWEQRFSVNSETYIKTISKDFTLIISGNGIKMTLINPSGVLLWNRILDFEFSGEVYEGRDGRFFVQGKKQLACYGINGICKWLLNTEEQSILPVQELEDGSLVLFLKKLDEGKTKALRITPFGKIIEEITFAGEILTAASSSKGIFVTFSDGSAGLFGIQNDKTINRFVLDKKMYVTSKSNFFISDNQDSNGFFITGDNNKLKIFCIDSYSGKILWTSLLPEMNLKNISETKITEEGIFISDDSSAVFLNKDGLLKWSGILPENKGKTKWNYLFFTENNTLVIVKDNWSMEAYIVEQHTGRKNLNNKYDYYLDYLNVNSSVYSNLYHSSLNQAITSEERYKSLEAGYYGNKEIEYTSDLLSACEAYIKTNSESYFGTREEPSVFLSNASGLISLFNQLPLYGTRYTTHMTSKLLLQENNNSVLNCITIGISKSGYDPDSEILNALENLAAKTSLRNVKLQMNICDAVYSICHFMGRPAFNKHGKEILKNFLFPANDSKVRIKARDTLQKIAALEK